MQLTAKEFHSVASEEAEDAFIDAFYSLCPFDDTEQPNSSPWGCPWYYHEDVLLTGGTPEELATNYFKSVEEEIMEIHKKENMKYLVTAEEPNA
jgi:hypothetical protein